MSVRIERKYPRPGGAETAWKTKQGYQLADPRIGPERHHACNAIFRQTLDETADLIERRGFSIRMGRKGVTPSLIAPSAIRIIR